MESWLKKHNKLSAFLLGSSAVLAMPPYYVFPVLLIAFGGLLYLLNETNSYKKSFLIGYLFGFGFFSFGFLWVGNAVLIEPEKTGWLYPVIFFASGAYFGLFAAVPAMLSHYMKSVFLKIFTFAATWTIFEWIRGWFLTGFPWNPMGSALAFNPLFIQLAAVFGVYGLSFLTVLFCCLPFAFLKGKKNFFVAFSLEIAIFSGILTFGFLRLPVDIEFTHTKVRLVQPSIPQNLKWNKQAAESNFRQYVDMSIADGQDDVDFVIWGETAATFNPRFYAEYGEDYKKAVPNNGYLISGAIDYEYAFGDRLAKNSMLVMDKTGEIVGAYDKMHLVPFGEYIPFREYLPDFIRPIANIIGDFKRGETHNVIALPDKPSFSGLICYEIIFPSQVKDKRNRPEWLALLTNDGWYGISMGPYQHLVAAEFRAVEEGLPIVRSANSGISAVIDTFGRVTAKIDLAKRGIVDAKIPRAILPTIYAEYGNLPIIIICLLILAVCGIINEKIRVNVD